LEKTVNFPKIFVTFRVVSGSKFTSQKRMIQL
jgi:hypothetical protein